MLLLANRVAAFLKKNRAYEVLGLFILLLVGVMLLSEGGHLAHLTLFGGKCMPSTRPPSTLLSPCSSRWIWSNPVTKSALRGSGIRFR